MESPHLHWGGKNSTFKLPSQSSSRENAVFVLARSGPRRTGTWGNREEPLRDASSWSTPSQIHLCQRGTCDPHRSHTDNTAASLMQAAVISRSENAAVSQRKIRRPAGTGATSTVSKKRDGCGFLTSAQIDMELTSRAQIVTFRWFPLSRLWKVQL